jgi:hypothetical protein
VLRPGGYLTPGEDATALRLERLFERPLRRFRIKIGREEAHGDCEHAAFREGNARPFEQELTGYLGHDADTVTALAVGRDGTAMGQPAERSERTLQHFVGALIREARDEADAAGVVVIARI